MVAEIKNFAPTRTGGVLKWIESQNLTMAGLDPATQQPRVGAANDSLRSRTLACSVTGHGEEFASTQSGTTLAAHAALDEGVVERIACRAHGADRIAHA